MNEGKGFKSGKRGRQVPPSPPPEPEYHSISSHHPAHQGWRPDPNGPIELENQFVLRLPKEPAEALREALKAGVSNVKERLAIQLEPDKCSSNSSYLRRGLVEFDGWSMTAKLMDLPTVIGSYKTIDRKNLYKTADICQILICKEGEAQSEEEGMDEDEEQQKQNKKPDAHKVDKKYRYPHGLTNPMKNCRKRRFRKTLKKKFVEAPEVEKEVKRLLRVDNEAVSVKWDLLNEDELNSSKNPSKSHSSLTPSASSSEVPTKESPQKEGKVTVEAQDIFGALSDSDDERPNANVDIDSEGDSNTFDLAEDSNKTQQDGPTEFSRDMFQQGPPKKEEKKEKGIVAQKLEKLRIEIEHLKQRKGELESNIAHCDNQVLLLRFQESLNEVVKEIDTKTVEEESMSMMFS